MASSLSLIPSAIIAIQIGIELARVARVTLVTREPIRLRRQKLLGQDIHHWAWLLGLDRLTQLRSFAADQRQ